MADNLSGWERPSRERRRRCPYCSEPGLSYARHPVQTKGKVWLYPTIADEARPGFFLPDVTARPHWQTCSAQELRKEAFRKGKAGGSGASRSAWHPESFRTEEVAASAAAPAEAPKVTAEPTVRTPTEVMRDVARRAGKTDKVAVVETEPEEGGIEVVEDATERRTRPREVGKVAVPSGIVEYMPANGEIEAIERGLRLGQNILCVGPPGCGKTHCLSWICQKLARPMATLLGADGVTKEDFYGYRDLRDGATVWRDGLAPMAMRLRNGTLYLDEPNEIPPGVRGAALSLLDHRRMLVLPENNGEVVIAQPGFTVVASMNEDRPLQDKFKQRFQCIVYFDYLPAEREATLLTQRTGIAQAMSAHLVETASRLRVMMTGTPKTLTHCAPIGTRSLLAWAARIVDGEAPRTAGVYTVENLASTAVGRKAIRDVVDAVLPHA